MFGKPICTFRHPYSSRYGTMYAEGRSSDLSPYSRLPELNQWQKNANKYFLAENLRLTATGIVPDSHRIPFSLSLTESSFCVAKIK